MPRTVPITTAMPCGDHRDQQRRARAVQHPDEDVSAGAVGSEPEARVRTLRDPELVEHLSLEQLVRPVADHVCRDDAGKDRRKADQHAGSATLPRAARSRLMRAQKSCRGERPEIADSA